ncbi:MAG: UTP--glucose-1-phosphate uridylyltransferase [Patescibacteria group bacterium]|nr:UTP--glucose-1-phosphate uridylyltransferase [Patescibacteria group bacterium]
MNKEVKTAIFPVAGFGTRFLPATKAQPKEMLPVVDKPAIQYLAEDAVSAGIEQIIFVTGRGKRAIEDHFDYSFELDRNLVEKNKMSLVEEVRRISNLANFSYVRQPMPLGDGHAVSCAAHLIGDNPVLVMFGDTLYDSEISPAKQVVDAYQKYGKTIVGLARVPKEKVSEFGVIDGHQIDGVTYQITNFVEKPAIDEAPSDLVAVGVYVITREVIDVLNNMDKGESGEIRLADAFGQMLKNGSEVIGLELSGDWLDTGNKLGWLKANIQLALKNSEVGEDLKQYIDSLK